MHYTPGQLPCHHHSQFLEVRRPLLVLRLILAEFVPQSHNLLLQRFGVFDQLYFETFIQ
jgi:hypothetical protein